MEFVITDADGFRFDWKLTRSGPAPFSYKMGLVPGRYSIRASTPKGHEGALDFDVKEGASKTVHVHLR